MQNQIPKIKNLPNKSNLFPTAKDAEIKESKNFFYPSFKLIPVIFWLI
jgi:hypothetical protein